MSSSTSAFTVLTPHRQVRGRLLDLRRLSSFDPLGCYPPRQSSLLQFVRLSALRPAQPVTRERISRACERLIVSHVNQTDTSLFDLQRRIEAATEMPSLGSLAAQCFLDLVVDLGESSGDPKRPIQIWVL